MQAPPSWMESAANWPKPKTTKAGTTARPAVGVSSSPPTWAELPAVRRRRLVVVLGTLVERSRTESGDERTGCSGRQDNGGADQ
jgi:hypothetical protein